MVGGRDLGLVGYGFWVSLFLSLPISRAQMVIASQFFVRTGYRFGFIVNLLDLGFGFAVCRCLVGIFLVKPLTLDMCAIIPIDISVFL